MATFNQFVRPIQPLGPLNTKDKYDPMPASVSAVFPAAAEYNMFQGLGKYDTAGGYLSNARHAAASALQRDALGGGIMGGIGANILGAVNELSGLAKGGWEEIKEKFGGPEHNFGETWRQTKEDLAANLYGSLYGKSTTDDMEYKFSPAENVYSDMIGQLGASSGTGFKGWLENIMEQEAEGSPLPHTLTLQGLQLHQQRLMNRRKQQMQETIRRHEAAEAAKQKAAADAAAAAAAAKKKYSGQGAQGGGGGTNIGGGQQTSKGIAGGAISHSAAKEARGDYEGWGLADGGLINFYRYGGFI